jgi:hypothetical protein
VWKLASSVDTMFRPKFEVLIGKVAVPGLIARISCQLCNIDHGSKTNNAFDSQVRLVATSSRS